jgi:hypothetical protein
MRFSACDHRVNKRKKKQKRKNGVPRLFCMISLFYHFLQEITKMSGKADWRRAFGMKTAALKGDSGNLADQCVRSGAV